MKLELSVWTHHLNHLLYSFYFFCKDQNKNFDISFNPKIRHNSALLTYAGTRTLFDYSDDVLFLVEPSNFDFYFKRSIAADCKLNNVFPLNFNVPLTYKALSFLLETDKKFLNFKHNRTELFRALDYFHLKTNAAHSLIDIRRFPKEVKEGNGQALFYTRLWNPHTTSDLKEKERRRLQNEFRINACRIIKNSFKDASVGIFPDEYSINEAPDLLLKKENYKKSNYLKTLEQFSIGIADDGLKDTPGWKIGEYLLNGKAVISTPIQVQIDQFKIGKNYLCLSDRTAYKELPDKIRDLQKDGKYMEMGKANLDWSKQYIHPQNYLNRILEIISNGKI